MLFPPAIADAEGFGTRVAREVERVDRARLRRPIPGCAEHPPASAWAADIPPIEIDPADPIVQTVLARERRRSASRPGSAASTRGTTARPTRSSAARRRIGFGPRSIADAHTIDESVPVDDLVRCAQAIALAAMRFCGTA